MSHIHGEVLSGEQTLDPTREIEAIVPYPYSSNIGLIRGVPTPRLSVLSRMSIDAAAVVHAAHPKSKVILIGETCYGADLPNTTDLQLERGIAMGIPKDSFVPLDKLANGRTLNNTWLQTRALAEYMESLKQPESALALSLDYHLQRVAFSVHAERQRIGNVQFAKVEDIFHAVGDYSQDRFSPVIDGLRPSERKLNFLNQFDRRGKLLDIAAKMFGARMVDIVENDDGTLTLENGTAEHKVELITSQATKQ